jgi:hypothetical protein
MAGTIIDKIPTVRRCTRALWQIAMAQPSPGPEPLDYGQE